MKRRLFLAAIAGLICFGFFHSCKVLDVEKEITFEIDLVVNESGATWDDSELLDAVAESNAIEDYQDLIKEISVVKVEYTVTYFNGPSSQQINTATLAVADASGNGSAILGTVTNENLQALTTTTKGITLEKAGTDRLSELIIDSPHTALIQYYGSANSGPMDFVVKFYITVEMTANPL